jgi:hypothetical protein
LYDQLLHDHHDLAIVAERRSEGTVTLAEMKKRKKIIIHYARHRRDAYRDL